MPERAKESFLAEGESAIGAQAQIQSEVIFVMPTFKGKTEDAAAPFLGADFWKPGVKIAGKVIRLFESQNGPCAVLRLLKPIQLNGEDCEEVSIGNLKGFVMALQAAGIPGLQVNDGLYAECTGFSDTTKGHARANFSVEVER